MLTFTTFTLLAVSLFTTATAILAMRREREELKHSSTLLDSVIELEKELADSYDTQSDLQADIAELNQQLQAEHHSVECYKLMHETELNRADALEQEILNNKESSYFLLESYQEELEVAQDCIWDKERQVSELAEANQKVADTLLSLSYKEGPVTPRELTELREIALRWDQIPF